MTLKVTQPQAITKFVQIIQICFHDNLYFREKQIAALGTKSRNRKGYLGLKQLQHKELKASPQTQFQRSKSSHLTAARLAGGGVTTSSCSAPQNVVFPFTNLCLGKCPSFSFGIFTKLLLLLQNPAQICPFWELSLIPHHKVNCLRGTQ